MHIDGPRGFAGVVEDARIQLKGLLRHLGDGVVVITLGHHAQAIAGRALREGQHELLGERRSNRLGEHLKRFGRTGLTDEGQRESGSVEAAQLVEFGECEGVLRLDDHETSADFDHAELAATAFVFTHFVGDDGLKSFATAEVQAQAGLLRHDGIETHVARSALAGHARTDLLFVDELLAGTCDRLERRRPANLLESRGDLLLLAIDVGRLKDVD